MSLNGLAGEMRMPTRLAPIAAAVAAAVSVTKRMRPATEPP
jgi:hypothetical protein